MDEQLTTRILDGDSREVKDLRDNSDIVDQFLLLCKRIDSMPDMKTRFYEDSRSLYQVTSKDRNIQELEDILSDFFGSPSKSAGKKLPFKLKFNSSLKYLGGIRKEQSLFIKKLKTGEFYGALWPWQRDPHKIEVHLGYCSPKMSDDDYNNFSRLMQKNLSKSAFTQMGADVGGQIHGISLPSFLQMSEMEESTFTLKVSKGNDVGLLFLSKGELIAAEIDLCAGSEAAYRIISWENVSIEIHAEDPDRPREINEPLMHILMESLKIKDEAGASEVEPAKPPSQRKAVEPAPQIAKKAPAKKAGAPVREKKKVPKKRAPKVKPAKKAAKPAPRAGFQKATDRSAFNQKKSILPKLIVAIVLVGLIGVSFVVGKNILDKKKVVLKYKLMVTAHDAESVPERKQGVLNRYLKENPNTPYRADVRRLLDEAKTVMEKQAFDKTTLEVNSLPLDDAYEKKALAIYTGFLDTYPESKYAVQINRSISGIRDLLGNNTYEQLDSVSGLDFKNRMDAYQGYLKRFPEGRQRKDVEKLIAGLSKENYLYLQKRAELCDKEKNWDLCIAECDDFISVFEGAGLVEKVAALKDTLTGKKELNNLMALEIKAGADYRKAKKIYEDYLKQNTNIQIAGVLKEKVIEIDKKITLKNEWENARSFAASGIYNVRDRAARLDAYIKTHPKGAYIKKAQALRGKLKIELAAMEQSRREKERKRKAYEQRQVELARMKKEKERIENLKAKARARLMSTGGRYIPNRNGTFTDNVTGLTWCLLDSGAVLSGCIDYNSALEYTKRLSTGGFRDWRVPTAGELAALYKNKPFLPDEKLRWYWSSETYSKGFHTVVDIVTSKKETVFNRQYKKMDDCGRVRAVRQ